MSERVGVELIVAAAENGVIGRDGELPWRLPADLTRFKQLTMGGALLMGRKTYESIGRPLPGRLSIVLTRNPTWSSGHDEVRVVALLEDAIAAAGDRRPFVIGGGEIYRLAMPRADRVYLTRVHATVDGDATFPHLDEHDWRLVSSEEQPVDDRNEHPCTFEVWQRVER